MKELHLIAFNSGALPPPSSPPPSSSPPLPQDYNWLQGNSWGESEKHSGG